VVVSQGHPVRGVDYPGTFQQLISWFSDEQACVDYVAQLRWGGGFSCPACGAGEFWTTAKGLRMCTSCGRKTSVTAGTVFHRSRTPLTTWFAAMWFLTASKNGISATNLHEVLGFGSYETAWAWLHKLRRSMVRPDRDRLSGVVEVDESFVGGRTRGTDGAGTDKTIVVIAVERIGPRKLGRVRLQSIPNSNNEFLLPVVRSFVSRARCCAPMGVLAISVWPARGTSTSRSISAPQTSPHTRNCPACTGSPRCSNDGWPRRCTMG